MKKFFLVVFFLGCISTLWFCQAKLFKHVSVKGHLIHFYTREPMSGIKVELRADDATSGKSSQENTLVMGTAHSGDDGQFSIKGGASRRDRYYIGVYETDKDGFVRMKTFDVSGGLSEKSTNELGDFLVGVKTLFCKIRVKLNASATTSIQVENTATVFAPGADSEVLSQRTYNHEEFVKAAGNYQVSYTIINGSVKTFSSISVPFAQNDTALTTITY